VNKIENADYIILNACGADEPRERDAINRISEYEGSKKDHTSILFLGCLPKINKDILEYYKFRIEIIEHYDMLDEIFYSNIKFNDIEVGYIDKDIYTKLKIPYHNGAFGLFLKHAERIFRKNIQKKRIEIEICQGCPFQCSYCAMNRSRGKTVVSRVPEDIITDIKTFIKKDIIINLIADDCGSYGIDMNMDLCSLIYTIYEAFPDNYIDIYYLNPFWLSKFKNRYLELVGKTKITSITIPVQSGSNKILSAMNRKYQIEEILNIIEKLRIISPDITIVTHLMVGFPGETIADFLKTLRIIKNFDICNPLMYSDRPGTESTSMNNKIGSLRMFIRHKILLIACVISFSAKGIKRFLKKLFVKVIAINTPMQ
jgi:MiaB/RimO family radical SAM methylthiotransferase